MINGARKPSPGPTRELLHSQRAAGDAGAAAAALGGTAGGEPGGDAAADEPGALPANSERTEVLAAPERTDTSREALRAALMRSSRDLRLLSLRAGKDAAGAGEPEEGQAPGQAARRRSKHVGAVGHWRGSRQRTAM